MPEPLLVVDERDRVLGAASKRACHAGRGLRHRAFLVMVYNRAGALLLARRSRLKRLWPGWWDGTVAGHVEQGETYASAARRRVLEELGVRPRLRRVDTFAYTARYRGDGENEICAVFAGRADRVRPDPREIDSWRWSRFPRGRLTPWLGIALGHRASGGILKNAKPRRS